ncbi:hypothetical protein [Nitrososphaera sp. AFS]|uniref:hypothetical protein n=1 Tax=Nitrososphaera sp. AFS TaxID=2301191 RepID=UPI00139224D3|nr:hypothetical protein [Nitrososphaera sp. AFS]NAL78155.1 hypothetical protein [Nitrososphaera sp. AFS]
MAISDSKAGSPFNPGCDPTSAHSSDRLHTTAYCNGWTNGYITEWNIYHSHGMNANMTSTTKSDYRFDASSIVTHV